MLQIVSTHLFSVQRRQNLKSSYYEPYIWFAKSVLIKSPCVVFAILSVLFLCGCVHTSQKTPVANSKDSVLSPSASTESATNHQDNNHRQEPASPDSAKSARYSLEKGETETFANKETTVSDHTRQENASVGRTGQWLLDEAIDLCQASQDFWQKGEFENALEALDSAYALILDLDATDGPTLLQGKEDLRFMISKRILEIYASRHIVVNGSHKAIPIVMNKYVQAEINLFTKGRERDFFIESYKRSGRYRPQIVSALKAAGLPVELSWLPLIESGFKVNAYSKARALGLWQFIPSTGYKFGLKRDLYIDERLNPIKSTNAAIAYQKQLHGIFGDWTTVLAGYNCGEARVLRLIRSQNINYLDNFWDLYERLPRETARYVPRFLATLHIVNNLAKYDFDGIEVAVPLEYETVEVSKPVHLRDVAKKIGATEKMLKELNPELRYQIVPKDGYVLKVPKGKAEVLIAKLPEIPVASKQLRSVAYHRIRRGETLSTIARRYRTSVSAIMRANNLRKSHYIVAGKLLKIPQTGYSVSTTRRHSKASTHVVKRGDSLWLVARRYGTNVKNIQKLNNLSTTTLHTGQVLKIRGSTNEIASGKGLKTYQVKPGDSPFEIALRHNMDLNRFLRINQLTQRSTIYPGQILHVE